MLPLGGGPDGKDPLFVHKGTLVAYNLWAMHRRKDYFGEDVEVFRPERWETLRPGWEYLPFNGGPRICLGREFTHPLFPRAPSLAFPVSSVKAESYYHERYHAPFFFYLYIPSPTSTPLTRSPEQYALTEASYVTTRILQEFASIESRDPGPWQEAITLTLASANGTKVALTPA